MSTLRRQGAWALLDQALSSGTNFVPLILLARVLGPQGYGTFSLAFMAWFVALSIIRNALMAPYTLNASPLEGTAWSEVTKKASGAVVLAGAVSGVVFASTAVVVGLSSSLGQSLLVLAVLAPGLALQEFWRVASFAASRARTATANDAYWAVGQIVAFGLLLSSGRVTAAGCLFAWGVGAVLAAGIGVLQLSVMPRVNRAALRWAREWGRIGAWFTAVTATYGLGLFLVAIIIAAEVGNAALGLFRTVQNLFGPIQLLLIAAESVYLPYLVRAIKTTRASALGSSWHYSLAMAGSVVAYGLVLAVVAHTVLTAVFGAAFGAAAVLVFPTMVAFALDAAASGASLLLRARALGRQLLVAQLAGTITRIAAVAGLVAVAGLTGAVWGLVIGSAVAAVALWIQVALTSRDAPDLGELEESTTRTRATAG